MKTRNKRLFHEQQSTIVFMTTTSRHSPAEVTDASVYFRVLSQLGLAHTATVWFE